MSSQRRPNKERTTGNQESKNQASTSQKKEKTLEIKLEASNVIDFNPISDSKFLSSKGLCELVSELFRSVYDDFEGSTFEIVTGTNNPMIALYFNHKEYSDDCCCACSRNMDDDDTSNLTLRSMRRYNRQMLEGDRYYLTQEGKDGIGDFLINLPHIKKKNGNVDWKKVVAEVADPNNQFYGPGVGTQLTKVSFIDPNKIVATLFGSQEPNGNRWEYGVRIVRSMPTAEVMFGVPSNDPNYMLAIDRVCDQNVKELAKQFGLSVNNGLGIIR